MLATIRVVRKDPDVQVTFDRATKTWLGGFEEIFRGKARVQPYGITGDQIVGQDPTGRRLMRVQIEDKETLINIDDMIEIVDSPENRELELFTMEVRSTISSSNSWLTDIVAEADLKHSGTKLPVPTPPETVEFPSTNSFPSSLTYPIEQE